MSRYGISPERAQLRLERAARFKAVRDGLSLTQPAFAELLTATARQVGLDGVRYNVGDITTRENGRKDLEIEDYVLAERVDAAQRSAEWLAFGRELKVGVAVGGKGKAARRVV